MRRVVSRAFSQRGTPSSATAPSEVAPKCMPSTPQLQAVEEQTPLSPASELAQESGSMRNASGAERAPLKPSSGGGKRPAPEGGSPALLAFCFVGLQVSYLTWGYVQEKVMTTEYGDSGRFPSATFCVFSNRVLAILVSLCMMVYRHGSASVPAPLWVFAPCSISNSLSSYGQYQYCKCIYFS